MAVPEQTPYIEHTGNGITTSFALGFQCETKDHLIVLIDDIEPPIATWSLTGGNVVFTIAPAAGKKITLQRNTPFSRTTDYQSYNNSFRPPAVNKDFDWIWWKLQELGVADWILGARIDALKNYVDRKDDELKAYLMEEIRKQGVALDQLDEYYNYLMQRLAQIAVDKGWDASFVVDGDKTQKQINDKQREKNRQRKSVLDYMTDAQILDALSGSPVLDHASAFQAAGDDFGYAFYIPSLPYRFNINTKVIFSKPTKMIGENILGEVNIKTNILAGPVISSNYGMLEVDGCGIEGSGQFKTSNITSENIFSFFKAGSNTKKLFINNCTMKNAVTYCVNGIGVKDTKVRDCLVIGGPQNFVDGDSHGMVIAWSGTRIDIKDNIAIPNENGGCVGIGLFTATQFAIADEFESNSSPRWVSFKDNMMFKLHSYSVYGILTRGSIITGNKHLYCKDPIIMFGTQGYDANQDYVGVIVSNNLAAADPALANTAVGPAIGLRHSNNVTISENQFYNYGSIFQITPNSARTDETNLEKSKNATTRNIKFTNNICMNYRSTAVQISQKSGDGAEFVLLKDIDISDNHFIQNKNDAAITAVQAVSVNLTDNARIDGLRIRDNLFDGAGSSFIYVSNAIDLKISGNIFKNCSRNNTGSKNGIVFQNVMGYKVIDNQIIDNRLQKIMQVGIDGSNTSANGVIKNNDILGWISAPMTKVGMAELEGNKTGVDSLGGVVTLSAATNTTIVNDNAHAGSAYQRRILLEPLNASAAGMASNRPYVSSQSNGISFTLSTANGTVAAGTEQFYYRIIG